MATFSALRALALIAFVSYWVISCGGATQPPKEQRPKLITKHWHLDTVPLRKEYIFYADLCWEKLKETIVDIDRIPEAQLKYVEDSIKRQVMTEQYPQAAKGLQLNFKPDGSYHYQNPKGDESGTYQFNAAFDTIRFSPQEGGDGFSVKIVFLSDSVLRTTGLLFIPTLNPAEHLFFPIKYKYIPIKN